jgi:hypothetical protein
MGHACAFELVQGGRIFTEIVNAILPESRRSRRRLSRRRGLRRRARLIELHESGTCVRLTKAGEDLL